MEVFLLFEFRISNDFFELLFGLWGKKSGKLSSAWSSSKVPGSGGSLIDFWVHFEKKEFSEFVITNLSTI